MCATVHVQALATAGKSWVKRAQDSLKSNGCALPSRTDAFLGTVCSGRKAGNLIEAEPREAGVTDAQAVDGVGPAHCRLRFMRMTLPMPSQST